MSAATREFAAAVLDAARARGMMIATAESCTGGLIIGALTDIAGSSDVVDRGFVTYSNQAKQDMLGVSEDTLTAHGAVSAETATEMAAGALARSGADLAISVTGVAGPGGGSDEKPVGLVWFGLAKDGARAIAESRMFAGLDREGVRRATVLHALAMLKAALDA
ncbi:MAG: CinA family protein [Zhengella sp.]|uniref:CinA family protein n=1 Tax=Zhengella sp. TaxID=2282762 RepID=UPI001DE734BA|nr:CinA family protein [Notoacmeibacter sp.]MCC0027936.1 CinA family protein [Brucellaceae bacterium]